VEILRRIFATVWKIWFALVFVIVFLIFYPFFVFFLYVSFNVKAVMFLKRLDGGIAIFLSGIFYKRYYNSKIKDIPQPCVIVANHTSYLDIILAYHALPINIIFMAKAELLKVPLFNIFFKKLETTDDIIKRIDDALNKLKQLTNPQAMIPERRANK
jgi:1-acyl-sn-glycerol-3-phosphate acyltransferase